MSLTRRPATCIESRKTKIVGSASPDMHYAGNQWSVEKDKHDYQGQMRRCGKAGNSVSFSFQGSDIYWRAVAYARRRQGQRLS